MEQRRLFGVLILALAWPAAAEAQPLITNARELVTLTSTSTRIVTALQRDIDKEAKIWRAVAMRRRAEFNRCADDLLETTISLDDWRWLAQNPTAPRTAGWVWPSIATAGVAGVAIGLIFALVI